MYIIDNNTAYLIVGNKAKKLTFNADLSYTVNNEAINNITEYRKYTYEEMIRKLNVRYFTKIAFEEAERTLIQSLQAEIAELQAENAELKQQLGNN